MVLDFSKIDEYKEPAPFLDEIYKDLGNSQVASSTWNMNGNKTKITIEIEGDGIESSDVYEQWKGVMEAIGFSMHNFEGED